MLGKCLAGEVRQQEVARRYAHVDDVIVLYGHQKDRQGRVSGQRQQRLFRASGNFHRCRLNGW